MISFSVPKERVNCRKIHLYTLGLLQSYQTSALETNILKSHANHLPPSDERWIGLVSSVSQWKNESMEWLLISVLHPVSLFVWERQRPPANMSLAYPVFLLWFLYFNLPSLISPTLTHKALIQSSSLRCCGVCSTISGVRRVINTAIIK